MSRVIYFFKMKVFYILSIVIFLFCFVYILPSGDAYENSKTKNNYVIKGRLIYEDGQPFKETIVLATYSPYSRVIATTNCNEEGYFSFYNIKLGKYRLDIKISPLDFITIPKIINVNNNTSSTLALDTIIVPQRSSNLYVKVLSKDLLPVRNAWVHVQWDNLKYTKHLGRDKTDLNGVARLTNLPKGNVMIGITPRIWGKTYYFHELLLKAGENFITIQLTNGAIKIISTHKE